MGEDTVSDVLLRTAVEDSESEQFFRVSSYLSRGFLNQMTCFRRRKRSPAPESTMRKGKHGSEKITNTPNAPDDEAVRPQPLIMPSNH